MAIPNFKNFPDRKYFLSFIFFVLGTYVLIGIVFPPNLTPLFEILIFLLPSIWFYKAFLARHFFVKENLAKLAFQVTIFMLVLSLFLNSLLPYWFEVFPVPEEFEEIFRFMTHKHWRFGYVFDLLIFAIIPGLCEEFLFRGIFQTGFAHFLKPKTALVLTSLLFAVFHFNPWYLPFYFILGLAFGWIFFQTKNLALAMLAHAINNGLAITIYYLS